MPAVSIISIGTFPEGTVNHAAGVALSRVFHDAASIPARLHIASGSACLLPLVASGQVDVGVANVLDLAQAWRLATDAGSAAEPAAELRMIAALTPIKVGLFVRNDSALRNLADIRGKTIGYGYALQRRINDVVDALLGIAGLTIGEMRPVTVPDQVAGAERFVEGDVEVGFFSIGAPRMRAVNAAVAGGIRFMSLAGRSAALPLGLSGAYIGAVSPGSGLDGVLAPLWTVFYDNVFFTSARMASVRVHRLTRAVAENKAGLEAAAAQFRDFDVRRMHKDVGVPYHEGALAYYREINIGSGH